MSFRHSSSNTTNNKLDEISRGLRSTNALTRSILPQFRPNPVIAKRFRYTSGSTGGAFSITSGGLLNLIAVGKVANSSVSSIVGAVRVKRVEVHTAYIPSGVVNAQTVSLEWQSSNSPNTEVSDTSLSPSYPATIVTTPPKDSLGGYWYNQGSTSVVLFILNIGSASIVDVWVDLTLIDLGTAPTALAVATAAVGVTYYPSLDNATGHGLPPVGLTTTF